MDRQDLARIERHRITGQYVQAGLWVLMILGIAVPSALAGHREAWFGVGQILAVTGYYVVRWTKLAVPLWLGIGLLVALETAAIGLAYF